MLILFWFLVLILSLFVLVKSADVLVRSSEKISLFLRIPSFIIGITLVAIGTSLPELATSLTAVWKGNTEIVAATVLGSNVADIFLIIGFCSIVGHRLLFERELIDVDVPLLLSSTFLGSILMWDKKVTLPEALILIFGFFIYLLYSFTERQGSTEAPLSRKELLKSFFSFILSVAFLAFAANYTVDSILKLADLLHIATSLLVISIVAVGTSLPELVVSLQGVLKKKYEIAMGNILGSCVFNILGIVGISGLFKTLIVDEKTFALALPFTILSVLLLSVSLISKKIHLWEGMMYLLIYIVFIAKLFNIF